jgi:hypothetical protein
VPALPCGPDTTMTEENYRGSGSWGGRGGGAAALATAAVAVGVAPFTTAAAIGSAG